MKNGANIDFLGLSTLIRQPGDIRTTNASNLTELQRSFCIRKDKVALAYAALVPGVLAAGYSNLRLFTPPKPRFTETHVYFDCLFYGVLNGVKEGGNGAAYEMLDKTSNLVTYSSQSVFYRFTQPIYRYSYTIGSTTADRSERRNIQKPAHVLVRNIVTGELVRVPGQYFFWEFFDIKRTNYGFYDECIESWKLTSAASI